MADATAADPTRELLPVIERGVTLAMRSAAHAAGEAEQFEFFRAAMVERNRRRPTCIEVFRRHGLA